MHDTPDPARNFMRVALEEAGRAASEGEVPVGAVVVDGDTVIGRGRNRPISAGDPTAHAEIEAIRQAAGAKGNYRIAGADLYVTLEPCLMCVGAAVHARIRRIVYGAADPKSGATWTLSSDWPGGARLNHAIEVVAGIEEERCAELLRRFFAEKRR